MRNPVLIKCPCLDCNAFIIIKNRSGKCGRSVARREGIVRQISIMVWCNEEETVEKDGEEGEGAYVDVYIP